MQYKKYTLKNGLRVILVPVADMTTATVLTLVGTGSRYEDVHENGLAHFLEHMFFKGTKRRPKADDISRELDGLGASFNAYTGKEYTGYYAKVAAAKILPAMDIIHDLFLHATMENREVKKESGAILQEINMYEDMPSRDVYDVFEATLYGEDHPLGRSILGPKENITSFTRKDFVSYKERCYSAANTVVCVAGNFPQGSVLKKIRADFAHLNKGQRPTYKEYENTQSTAQLRIKEKNTDQTHVMLGVKTEGFRHKERHVLNVLANILGGGMSSRLFSEIREKRGLAYHVGAGMDFYPETGTLTVQAGVEHTNAQKVISLVLAEMKKIAKNGVTQEELKRAKNGFSGRLAFGYESSDSIAGRFAQQEVVRGEIVPPEQVLKNMQKVTRSQIQKIANKIFVTSGLNCAIIGPHTKNTKKIQALLTF